jgi:hypothetical protein
VRKALIGRPRAATAAGAHKRHMQEQRRVADAALARPGKVRVAPPENGVRVYVVPFDDSVTCF